MISRNVLIFFALLALCAACAPQARLTLSSIGDSRWQLSAASFGAPPAGVVPTLELAAGHVYAYGGCNRARAAYRDRDGRLELGAPAATRLACGYARERFDRQYWRLLQASPAYRVDANVLTLTAGADSVRFKPAADAR